MTDNPDRRCGTCRWWGAPDPSDEDRLCEWSRVHLPFWLATRYWTRTDEGTDCPTWEAKP